MLDIPGQQQADHATALSQSLIELTAANTRYIAAETTIWNAYVADLQVGQNLQTRYANPPNCGPLPAPQLVAIIPGALLADQSRTSAISLPAAPQVISPPLTPGEMKAISKKDTGTLVSKLHGYANNKAILIKDMQLPSPLVEEMNALSRIYLSTIAQIKSESGRRTLRLSVIVRGSNTNATVSQLGSRSFYACENRARCCVLSDFYYLVSRLLAYAVLICRFDAFERSVGSVYT